MKGLDDQTLHRLIARADPAAGLAPATERDLVSLAVPARSDVDRPPGRAAVPRSRAIALHPPAVIAITAVAGVAVVAAIAFPLALARPAVVTSLEQPPAADLSSMCAPVSADALVQADSAFRAEARSITDGIVTLHVDRRFAGEVADTVVIPQVPRDLADGSAITFEAGATYLLATRDGVVLACGLSGRDESALEAVYSEAFPG